MSDPSNFWTIFQAGQQYGWVVVIISGILLVLAGWSVRRSITLLQDFMTRQIDNNRRLVILSEGARIDGTDRYITLFEIKEAVIENRKLGDEVVKKLLLKCEGMRCPLHEEILKELRDFSAKADTSREVTRMLVEGISDDVKLITAELLPIIRSVATSKRDAKADDGSRD